MVSISVVMPARNAAPTIAAELSALQQQTHRGEWELIIVDNGSTDGMRTVIEHQAGQLPLRVLDLATPGTNVARNAGAAVANKEFLVFVDADDIVDPRWLEAMATAAERADAVCGALEFDVRDQTRVSGLRTWPGFLPFATGANAGVRSEIFRELGGFDPTYSQGNDDVEFFWRVQLAGYEIGYVPDALVRYRERDSLRALGRQFRHYGRQDPHLYRDFRSAGMPGSGVVQGLRSWAHLIVLAPWYWARPARRRQWVRSTSRRLGRVHGSVTWRTIYL